MYNDSKREALPTYLSYLIRLWRTDGGGEWLASLESPGTHERHNFTDLASFFAFLQEQTGTSSRNDSADYDRYLMNDPD